LPGYDYGQAGAYFVTICTHNRRLFFQQNAVRAIAERCWQEISEHFPIVILDEWVVMPNHVHGIIIIADQNNNDFNDVHRRGVQLNAPTTNNVVGDAEHRDYDETNVEYDENVQLNANATNSNDHNIDRDLANRYALISPRRNTLSVIVRTYKAAVTMLCRREGHLEFRWQRSYYERIIRDDAQLERTRQYIIGNPANWK
jgi:REP element-mobilizing transposase RayT